ncbi:MAG TPA: ABC transporter ATP-binding protein [Gemmatimonadales bacterium]|nr:ABC transporter ATP-binding protein [Gemmatimonadales bacterium]
MSPILSAAGVSKVYRDGDGRELEILTGVDFEIERGEFVAIVGESGAGKSTLLHLLGALDRPTSGSVRLDGTELTTADATELDRIRNRHLGFVFQFHHLLRDFTALENVMMPLRILGSDPAAAEARATDLLRQFGLGERLAHRPTQLSGGEQQRVAVARALANQPRVVLADEPSGNLDEGQADRLHQLFGSLARDYQTALVVVTHNRRLAERADRVLVMERGRLGREGTAGGPE